MTKFNTLKTRMLTDPAVRAEYEALAPEFEAFRCKLLDGAASPPVGEADLAYFDGLRARVHRHKPD